MKSIVNLESCKNQKNGSPSYESNKGRISKLMKQSSYRREGIMFNIKSWCESENICLIGAPFETDFQEVGDEFNGITNASYSIDSDFFVLGSNILLII